MPRTPKAALAAEVISRPNGFVASAKNLTAKTNKKRRTEVKTEGWQLAAWDAFDTIGEYRFSVNWVGNILSKAKLTILENGKETKNQFALDALASLFGGEDGQTEMLRLFGIQFTVAGEAYLVGESNGEDDDDWYVAAAVELKNDGGGWKMGKKVFNDPLVVRCWRPHPRKHNESDSPSRAVLPILSEIDGLTKHVAAQIDSRLAGAGLLLIPNEITFGGSSTKDENGNTTTGSSADAFLQDLMDTMQTAISNREDAAALVPIVLQAAGEHLGNIKHLTFSTPLDEKAIELRAEAIRRLALGMDMPPEVLTGTAELNHWGSWQVEEASIKAHTEPLLAVITQSLTEGYLRPLLEEDVDDVSVFSFGADTSKMRLRPNRSTEALELYDRGELDGDTLRRENGFETSEGMDKEELAHWLAKKVAGGSTTPEIVAAALELLGVHLAIAPAAEDEPEETQEERPTPSLVDHPRRQPPDTLDDAAVAAADVMVYRAMERAGNRIKNRLGVNKPNVAAADLYMYVPSLSAMDIDDVLVDAWSCADRFDYGIPTASLDAYARMLLADQRKHDRGTLSAYLEGRVILEREAAREILESA